MLFVEAHVQLLQIADTGTDVRDFVDRDGLAEGGSPGEDCHQQEEQNGEEWRNVLHGEGSGTRVARNILADAAGERSLKDGVDLARRGTGYLGGLIFSQTAAADDKKDAAEWR